MFTQQETTTRPWTRLHLPILPSTKPSLQNSATSITYPSPTQNSVYLSSRLTAHQSPISTMSLLRSSSRTPGGRGQSSKYLEALGLLDLERSGRLGMRGMRMIRIVRDIQTKKMETAGQSPRRSSLVANPTLKRKPADPVHNHTSRPFRVPSPPKKSGPPSLQILTSS